MVAIGLVHKSNEQLRHLPSHLSSPTAVFIGATQGIGLATLRQLAIHTVQPTCYIVGRNEARVQEIIIEMKDLNVKGTYISVKGEVSLLAAVDECCEKIKSMFGEGKGLDLLFMSQGYISFGGRMSLLSLAPSPHVVSVLAGGREGSVYEDDLPLKRNYGVIACAYHGPTMTTLSFEHLAKENPMVAFVHVNPGYVKTGILQSGTSWPVAYLFKYILQPLMSFFAIPLDECGDRQLFHGTSSCYPSLAHSTSSPNHDKEAGVPLPQDLSVAAGSDGIKGSGSYALNPKSDSAPSTTGNLLNGYREKGMREKVWNIRWVFSKR